MSTGIAGLHKILKDETRRKIILQLNDKRVLTYTELLSSTGAGSTGRLNYHLKMLGDLVTKNESGQYILSEKGKLAVKLISEFPGDSSQVQRFRNMKLVLTLLGIGQTAYLSLLLIFYFVGQLEFYRLITGASSFVVGMAFLIVIYRMEKTANIPDVNEETVHMKFAYVSAGVLLFLGFGFFGVGIIFRVISELLGWRFRMGNPLYETLWNPAYMTFSMLIAPLIGGVLFYYLGKQKGFKRPKWANWIRSHF